MWRNWRLFGGIVLIYAILNLVLVRGFSGTGDFTALKDVLDSAFQGFGGKLVGSLITFSTLLTNSSTLGTAATGLYQTTLLIIFSLAFIWALRQANAGHTVRIRDSFYQGMYPLIPFILVFLLLGLQLLPLILGSSLYSVAVSNGIATDPWQRILFAAILVALCFWSLRMITATFFALYIVTLPDMTPLRAYRNARQMVYGRRLLIWRKLIFLPILLLLLAALLVMPLILFLTPVAVWVFFVLSMLAMPVVHSYMYSLYREML